MRPGNVLESMRARRISLRLAGGARMEPRGAPPPARSGSESGSGDGSGAPLMPALPPWVGYIAKQASKPTTAQPSYMALCIDVSPTIESVISAFAINDIVQKLISIFVQSGRQMPFPEACKPLPIHDDGFTAPFALIKIKRRKSKYNPQPRIDHKMVFSCNKIRDQILSAPFLLDDASRSRVAVLYTVDALEHGCFGPKVKRDEWIKFRENSFAGGDDICHQLDVFAFKTACSALNIPDEEIQAALPSWQQMRSEEWTRLSRSLLDLT